MVRHFLPILVFICLYVGCGLYFAYQGVDHAFYQISPVVAILPGLILAWIQHGGTMNDRMNSFLEGARHRDIMTMCIIFLLAGAFSAITKSIGSADATVHLALSWISPQYLLVGVFLTAAFISTAMGTSMGTIATLAPLVAGLADQGAFTAALGMGTVVAGAMFGDNLSLVSDTTIAAVLSQEADLRAKLKINVVVATLASILTIIVLLVVSDQQVAIPAQAYKFYLVTPYLFLIVVALAGVNVFVALVLAIGLTLLIGLYENMALLSLCREISQGFASMQEIMLLSLLVGGLSGLIGQGISALATALGSLTSFWAGPRMAQLLMVKIVSIFDILLANNTVAIIFSGQIVKDLAKKYRIPPHYSAAWLDIFSCVFQGILPYGAQILLASTAAGVSPLEIIGKVYYCYILGIVALGYIFFHKIKPSDSTLS